MRAVIAILALGLSVSLTPPAKAFDFQSLSTTLFGGAAVYGSETPDAREITWDDLTPPLSPEAKAAAARLNAMIDTMDDSAIAEAMDLIAENGDVLMDALDGEAISLEGYLVPLDYESTKARAFVLVPYMGACVHVPPPPPNQVVFVEFEEGVPMTVLEETIWTPFRVTGTLRAVPTKTELADVGYQVSANSIAVSAF